MNPKRWVLIVLDDAGDVDYCLVYEDAQRAGARFETLRRNGANAILCSAQVVGSEKREENVGAREINYNGS